MHPVDHLYGHHRTKEGSVFSSTPLLKNDKQGGNGVLASLKESMSNRKLFKTHVL